MKYFDAIIAQVIAWAVALMLARLAMRLQFVQRWSNSHPWQSAVVVAVLISGLLNALALLYVDHVTVQATNDMATRLQNKLAELDTLKANLRIWGGNDGLPKADNKCPDGYYVVAVSPKSVNGMSSGYLESMSVICRPLNAK